MRMSIMPCIEVDFISQCSGSAIHNIASYDYNSE